MSQLYTLVKKHGENLNSFTVRIKADSNDGDYIITESFYSKEDFDEYVAEGLVHFLKNASGRYKLEDYDNEYDLNIPYNGFDGYCHTLEWVKIDYVDANGETWDVKMNVEA